MMVEKPAKPPEPAPHAMKQIALFFQGWGGLISGLAGGIIFAVVVGVLGYADLIHRIEQVEAKHLIDTQQWAKLGDHETRLSSVEFKTEPISDVSWQLWGQVQKDVKDNSKEIEDLTTTVWRLHSRSWSEGIEPPKR